MADSGAQMVSPGEPNHFYLEGDQVLQVKPFVHRESKTVSHLCDLLSQNESVSVQPYMTSSPGAYQTNARLFFLCCLDLHYITSYISVEQQYHNQNNQSMVPNHNGDLVHIITEVNYKHIKWRVWKANTTGVLIAYCRVYAINNFETAW